MIDKTAVAEAVETEAVIGLEVHVELATQSKMFCACRNEFGAPPNTQVCPVCLGLPGALPVINQRAVEFLCKTALAFGCTIAPYSKFDRKNYFYPDLPKNYQISQYDMPLCTGGGVRLPSGKVVRLTRIHLEEDTGKNVHGGASIAQSAYTLVDYNRSGVPLMEIVSEPDIASTEEAEAYLLELKTVLAYIGVSDVKMHEGSLRCDANVSVRPVGETKFGVKTEIKNLNSFRAVGRALVYEIERMRQSLREGVRIVQETRGWDEERGVTHSMRSKEYAHDYRYFPDPDLVPLSLDASLLETWRAQLPELPAAKRERYQTLWGLSEYDARVITADRSDAEFFEVVSELCDDAKQAANWLMGDVRRALQKSGKSLGDSPLRPQHLAGLIRLVKDGTISGKAAKEVCETMVAEGRDPQEIVAQRGLAQTSDAAAIGGFVDEAVAANPDTVASYRAGKIKALEFLVGQVMKASRGRANVELVRSLLKERLGGG